MCFGGKISLVSRYLHRVDFHPFNFGFLQKPYAPYDKLPSRLESTEMCRSVRLFQPTILRFTRVEVNFQARQLNCRMCGQTLYHNWRYVGSDSQRTTFDKFHLPHRIKKYPYYKSMCLPALMTLRRAPVKMMDSQDLL